MKNQHALEAISHTIEDGRWRAVESVS